MQQFDLIIVGGGLAGASLALALRETRLRIALVEAHPPHRPNGWDARVYAISPVNIAFLESIGAWRHLNMERITPIRAMRVFGDGGGRLDFSAYETGVPELGCILESSLLACEFWEGAKRQGNLSIFCPARPAHLEFRHDAAVLGLADGTLLSGKLLVGADGRDSWVREIAGLASIDSPYREKGLVANFLCERPHGGTAFQWFRGDGVLAYLPLPGNRISIVWSTPDANADALSALGPELLCEQVAAAGRHVLGDLTMLTPAASFSLRLIRVPKTVAPRLALIGDAAHGIHPLSGHGVNLGFRDAKELACLLAVTQAWEDIGHERLLQRYRRARMEETLLLQSVTDGLHQLFRQTLPGVRQLRNFGLNLTNGLPLVKNSLVRYALGFN